MDKGSGSGIFPDPDPGDPKRPDPTGSGSGFATLFVSVLVCMFVVLFCVFASFCLYVFVYSCLYLFNCSNPLLQGYKQVNRIVAVLVHCMFTIVQCSLTLQYIV